jgi:hypothetical protein
LRRSGRRVWFALSVSEILSHVDTVVLQSGTKSPEIQLGGLIPIIQVVFEVSQMLLRRVKPLFKWSTVGWAAVSVSSRRSYWSILSCISRISACKSTVSPSP